MYRLLISFSAGDRIDIYVSCDFMISNRNREGHFRIRVAAIMSVCIRIPYDEGESLFTFSKCFSKRLWVALANTEQAS